MQRHVHPGADRGAIDHRDGWLAYHRDVTVQLRETMIKVLAHRVWAFMRRPGTLHVRADLIRARPFL